MNQANCIGEGKQQIGIQMMLPVFTSRRFTQYSHDGEFATLEKCIDARMRTKRQGCPERSSPLPQLMRAAFLARVVAKCVFMNIGNVISFQCILDGNFPVGRIVDIEFEKLLGIRSELRGDDLVVFSQELLQVCRNVRQADENNLPASLDTIFSYSLAVLRKRSKVLEFRNLARFAIWSILPTVVLALHPWAIAMALTG